MTKEDVMKKLKAIKLQFEKDYDEASMNSDGELGVHNNYEQGKEDALKLITEKLMEK